MIRICALDSAGCRCLSRWKGSIRERVWNGLGSSRFPRDGSAPVRTRAIGCDTTAIRRLQRAVAQAARCAQLSSCSSQESGCTAHWTDRSLTDRQAD
jgi:hypothetical protein